MAGPGPPLSLSVAAFSVFIWCVALRASKSLPRHPAFDDVRQDDVGLAGQRGPTGEFRRRGGLRVRLVVDGQGQVVQEIGYDDDCGEQLRARSPRIDGVELVDEDYDDVVDVVLLWWRGGDARSRPPRHYGRAQEWQKSRFLRFREDPRSCYR